MQCKKLEKIAPVQPGRKREYLITAQRAGEILILDVFKKQTFQGRHAIDTKTGEFMQYNLDNGKWLQRKFGNLLDLDMRPYGYYYGDERARTNVDTKEMEEMIREALMTKLYYTREIFDLIDRREQEYGSTKRKRIEDNRVMRVQEKMALVPPMPEKVREWIWRMEGAEDYIFKDKETKKWHCTACRKAYDDQCLCSHNKVKKIRHNDMIICPKCGKDGVAKTRTDNIEKKSSFYLAQRLDDRMSVWRSFDVIMRWTAKGRRIWANEGTRIIMYSLSIGTKYAGEIFYNQYRADGGISTDKKEWDYERAYFDNKSNQAQRRMGKGYLYLEGIEEALEGTAYHRCGRIMSQMAADGIKLNYNRLMSTQGANNMIGIIEYLYKGRFYQLLEETADRIEFYGSGYYGSLNRSGSSIEEIFGIHDRQLINRIRDENGGENMLAWMRLSEKTGRKINAETLRWLDKNRIWPENIAFLLGRMTPQQIMNYVIRQQAEGYKGNTAGGIINQWADYISMLAKLGKKIDDEMMYRPRELKRRHDECVEEINARRIREEMKQNKEMRDQEARKMRKRFPGAEEILQEIRERYEWADNEYIITVPRRLVDIIAEGQALHHCAGATDRYFDRIMQRETYICFLRKKEDPETPYYTIEVEPGGTIRQHRGYMDEEPNIEQIRPFLRKWQGVLRKRMTRADREHAAASAVKRQENIEELKAKNNTRVLRGLMEDFMLAEDAPEQLLAAGS